MSKKTERTERATVGSSIECDEGCSADKKKIKKRKPAALTIDKSKKVKENIVSVAKTVSHEENLNSKSESSIENEEYEKETQDFDDLSDSKDVSSPIPPEEPSIGSPNNNEQGEFRVDAKEWVWDFAKDCRLRVGMVSFREALFYADARRPVVYCFS